MNLSILPGKIHDISVTLRKGLACWPDEDFWSFESVCRIEDGAPCNVSKFAMGCHMGTHVDSPWHFGKGTKTIEQIGMDQMVIPARVIDLTGARGVVGRGDLEGRINGAGAVLLKTTNSGRLESGEPFDTEFVHLDAGAADYLIESGVRTVGVDYLSVEGFHAKEAPVHHRLLGADIFIVEGLDLSAVAAGDYLFVVLPLKIRGSDGAPARAILIETA